MRRTALSTFLFAAILGLGCLGVAVPSKADDHCEDESNPRYDATDCEKQAEEIRGNKKPGIASNVFKCTWKIPLFTTFEAVNDTQRKFFPKCHSALWVQDRRIENASCWRSELFPNWLLGNLKKRKNKKLFHIASQAFKEDGGPNWDYFTNILPNKFSFPAVKIVEEGGKLVARKQSGEYMFPLNLRKVGNRKYTGAFTMDDGTRVKGIIKPGPSNLEFYAFYGRIHAKGVCE